MTLADIIAALPRLSAAERAQIVNACKAFAQMKGEAPAHAPDASMTNASDADSDLLLGALCAFMRDRGLEFSQVGMIKKTNAYQSYRKRSDFIGPWLAPSKLTRTEKGLLFAQVVPMLHQYLAWGENVVGANQLLTNAFKLPAVVDAQMPGYAKAGLLKMAIRR